MHFQEQISQLKFELEHSQSEVQKLREENADLKVLAEKTRQAESAFQSNNAIIAEKIAATNHQSKEMDA